MMTNLWAVATTVNLADFAFGQAAEENTEPTGVGRKKESFRSIVHIVEKKPRWVLGSS